jgi:glycosyltransferase involved in cell wall biosynthesis
MRRFLDKVNKYFKKVKRDGLISATKKAAKRVFSDYLSFLNIPKLIKFQKQKIELKNMIIEILNNTNYDRIIIWRSTIGWNIPLFQRPQHLANNLSDNKCLVFYEVTRVTDKINFIEKKKDNLYLIDYESKQFAKLFREECKKIDKSKYIFTASTCWDLSDVLVDSYIKEGYKFLYDYLDHLSPELAGTDKLPQNVENIHNYVINNVDNVFVVATADVLYEDMKNKRKTDKNLLFACNGVDYNHFAKLDKKVKLTDDYMDIINDKKPIIGYYGALASWFDYDLVKYIAKERKDFNIVLIGSKYDTSFDKQNLEKYKNIYYLGVKKFDELPYYATHFDVCTLPFLLNDITKATSPIKVFEYMALGKPIVTTDLRECRKYKSIKIAKDKKEFLSLCDKMIDINDKNYFEQLKEDALNNTWQSKAKDIIKGLKNFEKNKR